MSYISNRAQKEREKNGIDSSASTIPISTDKTQNTESLKQASYIQQRAAAEKANRNTSSQPTTSSKTPSQAVDDQVFSSAVNMLQRRAQNQPVYEQPVSKVSESELQNRQDNLQRQLRDYAGTSDSNADRDYAAAELALENLRKVNAELKSRTEKYTQEQQRALDTISRPENYDSNNIADYYSRARQLADLNSWNDAQREEARQIYYVLPSFNMPSGPDDPAWNGYADPRAVELRSSLQASGNDWANVRNTLEYKLNPTATGFMTGLAQGMGIAGLAEAGTALAGKLGVDTSGAEQDIQQFKNMSAYGQKAAPLASAAGNVIGSIALMKTLPNASSVPGFRNLPNIAQSMLSGATALGGKTAVQQLGDLASGNPEEYLADVAVSMVGGAAGGALSGTIANKGFEYLNNHGLLPNKVARSVVAGLAGSGFSSGTVGVNMLARELGYKEGQKVSASQLFQDALVGFAFGALNYYVNGPDFTMRDPEAKREFRYFREDMSYDEAKALWRKLAMENHPDRGGDTATFQAINDEWMAWEATYGPNAAGRAAAAYDDAVKASAAGNTQALTKAQEAFTENVLLLQEYAAEGLYSGEEAENAMEIIGSVLSNGIVQPADSTDLIPVSVIELGGPVASDAPESPSVIQLGGPTAPNIDGEALASQSDARNDSRWTNTPANEITAQNGAESPVEAPVINTRTDVDATAKILTRMALQLGKSGSINLTTNYDGERNVTDYVEDFTKVYNAAKEGKAIPENNLSPAQEFTAKAAGENDAKLITEAANDGRTEEETGDLSLRQGQEWNDGQNTSKQAEPVARGSELEEWKRYGAPADRGTSSLTFSERKVSAKTLGASSTESVQIRDTENLYEVSGKKTKAMQRAEKIAASRGQKIHFFAGGYIEAVDSFGLDVEARAMIQGKDVYLKVDDPEYSCDRLYIHEDAHDKIASGAINKDAVIRKLGGLDQTALRTIAEAYADLYEMKDETGTVSDELIDYIVEEIICDAAANMNVFKTINPALDPVMTEFLRDVREAIVASEAEPRAPTSAGNDIKFSSRADVLKLDNVDWMDNNSRIRTQLSKHSAEINAMAPVAVVEYVHNPQESLVEIMMNSLPDIGGGRIKRGSVEFDFDRQGAQSINAHATGAELRASALAAPYVAKYGKLIAGQKNHEGRGFATLTYAAPVVINGSTVNVGLAVQFTNNGRPRAVNVEVQDGSVFRINKTSRGTSSRVGRYDQGTALDTRDASINKIPSIKASVKDNQGNTLSKEQQDSKYLAAVNSGDTKAAQRMVDEAAKKAGYTITGYHGTDASFNEFKIGDVGYHIGTEAQANDRIKDAGSNSRVIKLYAKIQNPLSAAFDFGDWHGKNVADMLLETEQWEEGYDENADEINARLEEIADMPDNSKTDKTLRDYLKSLGYDGIQYANEFEDAGNANKSYIAFDSSQLKLADPVTYDDAGKVIPLSERFDSNKPDIRFSMKAPIEQTDRLIAWHNMNESALESALDLGGLAMPSFAIKPADSVHDTYGPVSILAYRESVEPNKSGSQMIFGGDAWTPTFPEVQNKISTAEADKLYDKVSSLLRRAGTNINALHVAIDTDNLSDKINRWGSFEEAYRNEDALMLAFLEDTGRSIEVPMKSKGYSADADIMEKLAGKYGDIWPNGDVMQYEPEIRKALYDDTMQKHPNPIDSKLKSRDGRYLADFMWGKEIGYGKMDTIMRELHYIARNGLQQEIDTSELRSSIESAMKSDEVQNEYYAWLKGLGKDVVEKKGIRNDKDMFTASGKRRSFEQLHYEYNLDNIIRAMRSQAKQGRTQFLSGPGSAKGAALKAYSSIEDVRADRSRIVPEKSEVTEAAYQAFNDQVKDLSRYMDPRDWLEGSDIIADVLSHSHTEAGIKRYLRREYGYLETQDHKDLDRITRDMLEIVEEANKLPMEYFESKLYREFPLDEAAAIIVPDTTSQDLIQRLEEAGAKVETYKAGDNEDRLKVANGVRGAKFSRRVPASDPLRVPGIHETELNQVATELKPIAVDKSLFQKSGKSLVDQVYEFYQAVGGKAVSPDLGDVLLTRRGIKADIAHGLGSLKSAAFAAVPDVIREGKVVAYDPRYNQKPQPSYVIAAPITVGGEDGFMAVILLEDEKNNKRLYLHEIVIKKDDGTHIKTRPENSYPGGVPSSNIYSILNRLLDVKNGVDISGVTVNDVTERLNVSESDAAPAVEAINSFDGVQIEMDLAGLLKKKDVQTAFDAFKRDLIYDGGVSFVGRTFRNASELAAAANIFRDPRFETVRYIFTDAEGKVVMNTGVSSQIPNCSPIFTKPQMLPDIFNKAQDLGARNVYMMHNHPSGDPTPSGADFGAAKYLEEFAAQGHIKMRECIIINHKKGTLFRGDGTVDRFDYSAGEADPLLNVGDTIRGPKDMLKIAESINSKSDDVVFIYSNSKGSVTGIQKVAGRYFTGSDGSGQFGKLKTYLHDNGLSFGANSIFAYTKNPSEGLMSVLEGAYMQGFLRDVTGSGEPSLHEQGVFSRGSSDNEYMGQKHRAESRFSRRASNDSIEQLRQSNDELRNTVAQLNKELKAETARANKAESQLKRTEKPTARAEDIRKLAGQYTTGTDADINEAAAKMQALADKIIQGGSEGVLVYDELMDDALDIVRPIVDGTKELMNGQELETINGIRKYFRDGKFHFDNMARYNESASNIAKATGKGQTRGEITDYEDLRRRNFGRFTLTKNVNARAIDDAWKEAQEMFGTEYFPEDINSIPDMILHISELLDTLGPVYANPYSYDIAEAKQWMANELLNDLIGESVRQTAPTYADRMHQKLERQAYQAREKMNEALAKEREKRDEIVKAVKDHYKEIAAAKRERKLESAERTKLLNIAKRLANKKLPAANRALINQYIGDLDLTAKSITGKSIKKLSELRDWYDERKASDPDFISDPNIEKAIARLGQHHISELTIGEVRELTDVLLNIENELRTERELIDSQVRHDTYMAGLQTIQDILNSRGVSKGDKLDNLFIGNTLSPLRALHRMTGYNDNSPLYKLTQELAAGQRKMFDFQMRARKNFESWANDKKFTDAVSGKNSRFIWITGHTADGDVKVRITPAMRMSLYLHSLNDQNLRHIQGGGLTIPDEALYKAGEIAEAYARGITVKLNPSEVRAIAAGMTPEERAFANAARKYFNGMSQEAINEVSEKLKGYSLAQVEEYFPITTDPNYSKRDFESLKFDGTIEGMGFLKERVNASNPIMLQDMNEVLNRSIDNTSRYVGLAIPVRNFNKVWGVTSGSFNEDGTRNNFEGSVQKAIGQKYGTAGKQYIENLMKDLQSGKTASEDWGKLMNRLRSNYAKAVLTLNASVAMKQAASYPTAGAVLGGKALARAMADFGKVDLDLIARYTPLQWYRAQGFSTQELGDMARNNKQLPRILNWVQGMDLITTRKLWKASEYYVRDNFKDLERGTDAYYRKVAEIYNRVIEETQPNYTTMQRPGILRTDNTLLQSILMFKTQPFQNFNVVYDAYGNLIAKQAAYRNTGSESAKAEFGQAKKAAWDATWSQVAQLAIFAGMTFLWNMFRGKRKNYEDEEGEITTDSVLKKIGKDMLGGAASGIPGGAELWEMANSFLFGDRYYGIDSVTASALADTMSSMLDVANEWRDLTEALRTGDEIDWNKERFKIEKMVNTISKTAGVPAENVMNLFKAFFMYGAEAVQGKYLGEYAYLKLTVNPASYPGDYYDLLYKARQKDPEAYSLIYNDMLNGNFFTTNGSEYFTEKKIKSNMEKRMKADGDESKYMSPGMEKAYSQGVSAMQHSDLWNDADARQRQAAEDLLSKNYSDAEKLDEKLSGARQHGMSESDFALYLLALSMYDEPNKSGNYGSYTGEEKLAAADALNLDAALAEYLKSLSY